jgi:hypothetical protein
MTENCVCCVCDMEFHEKDVKHIEIKGKVKDICKECVTSIKGLL